MGEFRFPGGDAASVRTLSLARVCRDLGYQVLVLGKGRVRPEDYHEEKKGFYVEDIRYSTMNPRRVSALERVRHPLARWRLFVSALENAPPEETKAVVINASSSARHVPLVSAFCRARSIPLVGDVCEWYEPCQMKYGRLDPAYAVFSWAFHYCFPRLKNLIVVSKLLESRFAGSGRNVLRVAAPFDVRNTSCLDQTPTDRLVFLYAGVPGRKDLLKEIIVALASLAPEERSRVEFRLLGPTEAELAKLLGKSSNLLKLLGTTVRAHGRVSHEQVIASLQEAHFTVLLRPNRRYANAGFPSKVAESLAAGVPVLLNYTSDLEEYLGDGTAALAVRDTSPAEVAKAIRKALGLTPSQLLELRRSARRKAEQYFDYRVHLEPVKTYLENLQ